jgi:hypothetical protein
MNYKEELYKKYQKTMLPIREGYSKYYFYKGFKFEKITLPSRPIVYLVWNTCTKTGYYSTITNEFVLKTLYLEEDLTGWSGKLHELDLIDNKRDFIDAITRI